MFGLDVEDAAEAYVSALAAPMEVIGVFNISNRNYTLAELAQTVATSLKDFGVEAMIHTEHRADVRSYRVSTEKAERILNFKARKSMSETVGDIVKKVIDHPLAALEDRRYYNIRQMEHLMAEGLLNGNGHAVTPKQAAVATITG